MVKEYNYQGGELELFKDAVNWKKYFSSKLRKHIGNTVLEVGAGIGGTTKYLCQGTEKTWVCLEPDTKMFEYLQQLIQNNILPSNCKSINGKLINLPEKERFDTVIYIDVLEHIEDDKNELLYASSKLKSGGKLITLSPAFKYLYSEFDQSIGHERRYNKKMIKSLTNPSINLVHCFYLDSIGYLASLTNRLWTKSSLPKPGQIAFWDKFIIPISKVFDVGFSPFWGRSIVAIWEVK